jgi:hypothetical protein
MNEIAGEDIVVPADIESVGVENSEARTTLQPSHMPVKNTGIGITPEEAMLINNNDTNVPELANNDDDDSDDKMEDDTVANDEDDPLDEILQQGDSYTGDELMRELESAAQQVEVRRSQQSTAGVKRYDEAYNWNLMNLSVTSALREFGEVAEEACKSELVQLFKEKKALVPIHKNNMSDDQLKKVVRSHMFLKEKFEDGTFVKLKARLVADGRIQDRLLYSDYSSSTAKTCSVMTCLKLAAVKNWKCAKVDVSGAFLCAKINEKEEVFLQLDRQMTDMVIKHMPDLKEYQGVYGTMIVRVDRAMYRFIQSPKLWYKELTSHLIKHGFKVCKSDECIIFKKQEGKSILLLLYIDDILILSDETSLCRWVKDILVEKYEKVTCDNGNKICYLGMTLKRNDKGYEISMKPYIEEIISFYGGTIRETVNPAKMNLFEVNKSQNKLNSKAKVLFHSVVAKLLYLGKCGRPDILLAVQFLCTRVQGPTDDDKRKLERVLGYLSMTKNKTRVFDKSNFERVTTYIDASFGIHEDGKSQSGCLVMLGNNLVHDACRKHKIIRKKSTEAELVVLSDYHLEGELIEEFLLELLNLMEEELITNVHLVYQDNTSMIALVKNGGGKPRSKYMKVRQEYMRERVSTGELEIEKVKTCQMLADILTKTLGGEHFHTLVNLILGCFPYLNNRGAKKNTSQTTQNLSSVTDVANSLECLTWSNHGNWCKHKVEPQNIQTKVKKHTKKYRV